MRYTNNGKQQLMDIQKNQSRASVHRTTEVNNYSTALSRQSVPSISEKKVHFKFRYVTVLIIVIFIVSGLFILQNINSDKNNDLAFVVSGAILQKANYPLYFPSNLPSGFLFDSSSISEIDSAVMYQIKSPEGKLIHVSLQSLPTNIDFDEFHKHRLFEPIKIDTPLGGAYIGRFNNAVVGSQTVAQTWILIRAPIDTNSQDITTVLKSLIVYKN